MIFIDWNDVMTSKRLQDGDVVTASTTDIASDTIELVLELAPHKQWWKGVQLLDNTDGQVGFIEVEGAGGRTDPIAIRADDVEVGGKIILWKAKLFGVHTPMYILADLEQVRGKRVTFRWSAD
jgi:hypothetical protein